MKVKLLIAFFILIFFNTIAQEREEYSSSYYSLSTENEVVTDFQVKTNIIIDLHLNLIRLRSEGKAEKIYAIRSYRDGKDRRVFNLADVDYPEAYLEHHGDINNLTLIFNPSKENADNRLLLFWSLRPKSELELIPQLKNLAFSSGEGKYYMSARSLTVMDITNETNKKFEDQALITLDMTNRQIGLKESTKETSFPILDCFYKMSRGIDCFTCLINDPAYKTVIFNDKEHMICFTPRDLSIKMLIFENFKQREEIKKAPQDSISPEQLERANYDNYNKPLEVDKESQRIVPPPPKKGNYSILMKKSNSGTFEIPCKVNGLALKFVFDTGASDVTISSTEAIFMAKNGYLETSDILEKQNYQIANGSIMEGTNIILREIEIQGLKLYNVHATVINNATAPLLLGQSAISKLGKIQIDYAKSTLTIIKE